MSVLAQSDSLTLNQTPGVGIDAKAQITSMCINLLNLMKAITAQHLVLHNLCDAFKDLNEHRLSKVSSLLTRGTLYLGLPRTLCTSVVGAITTHVDAPLAHERSLTHWTHISTDAAHA